MVCDQLHVTGREAWLPTASLWRHRSPSTSSARPLGRTPESLIADKAAWTSLKAPNLSPTLATLVQEVMRRVQEACSVSGSRECGGSFQSGHALLIRNYLLLQADERVPEIHFGSDQTKIVQVGRIAPTQQVQVGAERRTANGADRTRSVNRLTQPSLTVQEGEPTQSHDRCE